MNTIYTTNSIQSVPSLVDDAVDLSGGPYSFTETGLYEVIAGSGDVSYNLRFQDGPFQPFTVDGQVIIVANKDLTNIIYTDLVEVPVIPCGQVYTFVSNGIEWKRVISAVSIYADGAFFADNSLAYPLPGPGAYVMRYDNYKPEISLPDPILYDGQSIIIFHANYNEGYRCKIYSDIYNTRYQVLTYPFEIASDQVLKLISCGGVWRKEYYSGD